MFKIGRINKVSTIKIEKKKSEVPKIPGIKIYYYNRTLNDHKI